MSVNRHRDMTKLVGHGAVRTTTNPETARTTETFTAARANVTTIR